MIGFVDNRRFHPITARPNARNLLSTINAREGMFDKTHNTRSLPSAASQTAVTLYDTDARSTPARARGPHSPVATDENVGGSSCPDCSGRGMSNANGKGRSAPRILSWLGRRCRVRTLAANASRNDVVDLGLSNSPVVRDSDVMKNTCRFLSIREDSI